MKTNKTTYTIAKLVRAWDSAQLRRNPEYQRGAAWSRSQKQALIDSAFRQYPLPPLFLEKIVSAGGLDGETSIKYDVVDGQQRLLAFHEYYRDSFPLLEGHDRHLRLPSSLRGAPASWAKRKYSELGSDLKSQLDETVVDVFVIEDVENSDEVRDLFIRLQSGTALTRQQIRDAWPGNIGPYIEGLAGKLQKRPTSPIFRLIDKRGSRSEEDSLVDDYVNDRQTCAQLLRLFLARERDPRVAAGVSANDLDALYHEHTNLDTRGESAKRFQECLANAAEVFELIKPVSTIVSQKGTRTKVRKLDAFATVMFFQDVSRNPHFKIDKKGKVLLAHNIADLEKTAMRSGKGTSGVVIRDHYEHFRENVADGVGLELDPKRVFDNDQKAEIWRIHNGVCAVCSEKVELAEAEGDHYPVPYRDGGRTSVDNGRPVHQRCHPRGRPAESDLDV